MINGVKGFLSVDQYIIQFLQYTNEGAFSLVSSYQTKQIDITF